MQFSIAKCQAHSTKYETSKPSRSGATFWLPSINNRRLCCPTFSWIWIWIWG